MTARAFATDSVAQPDPLFILSLFYNCFFLFLLVEKKIIEKEI